MASQHLVSRKSAHRPRFSGRLDPLDRVQLSVSVQTLYDLRSQGRGPRGFRLGRELRFRVSEVDAWLARLEEADARRHPAAGTQA